MNRSDWKTLAGVFVFLLLFILPWAYGILAFFEYIIGLRS
jgi:hypothetical protein